MNTVSDDSFVFILDDILMMILALVSVGLLVVQTTSSLTISQVRLFNSVDFTIALIFLFEFVAKLLMAPNKRSYLKQNWWYLLASIPVTTPATQALRALRLLRLVRLIRLVTGTRAVLDYLNRFFKQTHVFDILLVFALIVGVSAVSFDFFEYGVNPSVHGFFDSFWWAMTTVTTIGYGDLYPITTGGRITAMFLMILGIGMSGAFTALVASFLVREHKRD